MKEFFLSYPRSKDFRRKASEQCKPYTDKLLTITLIYLLISIKEFKFAHTKDPQKGFLSFFRLSGGAVCCYASNPTGKETKKTHADWRMSFSLSYPNNFEPIFPHYNQ